MRGLRRPVRARARRTRSSRRPQQRGSRSSSPPGTRAQKAATSTGRSPASTGSNPVAQAVDPSTSTLYVASKGSNRVNVISEGNANSPASFVNAGSVHTGTGPDAVALDPAGRKGLRGQCRRHAHGDPDVDVQPIDHERVQLAHLDLLRPPRRSGCAGGQREHALRRQRRRHRCDLQRHDQCLRDHREPSLGSTPTALAVDTTNGFVYVADGTNNRVDVLQRVLVQRDHDRPDARPRR